MNYEEHADVRQISQEIYRILHGVDLKKIKLIIEKLENAAWIDAKKEEEWYGIEPALYPCPFCGSRFIEEITETTQIGVDKFMTCMSCFANGPSFFMKEKDEMIHKELWNKRV